MITRQYRYHRWFTLMILISIFASGCSQSAILETPQGNLKVESLEYQYYSGSVYANSPHRLILTLSRADGEMFSIDDLNYIIKSGAYLNDNQGHTYSIPDEMAKGEVLESQTDTFRLEFVGKPGKDKSFLLYWPENEPFELERENHVMLDG